MIMSICSPFRQTDMWKALPEMALWFLANCSMIDLPTRNSPMDFIGSRMSGWSAVEDSFGEASSVKASSLS